jgi:DNA-binding NarL/FixJ family response regulator
VRMSRLPSKVIIVTTSDTEEDVQRADEGGRLWLPVKRSTQEEILDAIPRASLGETYFPVRI